MSEVPSSSSTLFAVTATMSEVEWDRVHAEEEANGTFLETDRFYRVREHLGELLERSVTRADPNKALGASNRVKGRALLLTGSSGCGKSETLKRAIQSFPALRPVDQGEPRRPILSINAPDQPSPSAIYGRLLQAIGYPPLGARSGEIFRQRLLAQTERLATIIIHIDDAANMVVGQDPFRTRRSAQKISACLRGLMEEELPLSLIISGLEPAHRLLEHDEALARRCQQVRIPPVGPGEDKVIGRAIFVRAKKRGLAFAPSRELLHRLVHAANHQFGLSLELAWHAISRAEQSGASHLEARHFAEAYHRRTECGPGLNAFEASDWTRIDTSAIIPKLEDSGQSSSRGRRK